MFISVSTVVIIIVMRILNCFNVIELGFSFEDFFKRCLKKLFGPWLSFMRPFVSSVIHF